MGRWSPAAAAALTGRPAQECPTSATGPLMAFRMLDKSAKSDATPRSGFATATTGQPFASRKVISLLQLCRPRPGGPAPPLVDLEYLGNIVAAAAVG